MSADKSWFLPEDAGALQDFFRVYDAHVDIRAIVQEGAAEDPELGATARVMEPYWTVDGATRKRQLLRAAMGGDWGPYQEELEREGAHYATHGGTGWKELVKRIARLLTPKIVEAYGADPPRAGATLVVMHEFLWRVRAGLEAGFVRRQETMLRDDARRSEDRYRSLFDNSPIPAWLYDRTTLRFLEVNDAALSTYGYSRDEFLSMTIADIRPKEEVPDLLSDVAKADGSSAVRRWRHTKKDGTSLLVEITAHALALRDRDCRLVFAQDVSARDRLEEQLRQAQKMEAIGRLAGGVAHDFNNVLSVILSYAEIILGELPPGDRLREDVEEIKKSGQRAAGLTRQLLMFSRRQVLTPRVVDLNDVLAGADKMLRRLLGEDIELVSVASSSPVRVRVDPGSIEQVIMNLAVNARDAMPRGGKLTMETASVVLDDAYTQLHPGIQPGKYVMLAVTDNGTGIDRETQSKVFDPFFTTKEVGKGTGLGLSTVFGIVRQSQGSIWLYSEPDRGTTFKVYLPSVDLPADQVSPSADLVALRGTETILLVEDEPAVREVARSILRGQGYRVIEATNPADALLACEKHPEKIDLLFSDVVMPGSSGPELGEKLARLRPGIRVLYMSGYTDDSVIRHGLLEGTMRFLQKPFTPEALTRKVREALDA